MEWIFVMLKLVTLEEASEYRSRYAKYQSQIAPHQYHLPRHQSQGRFEDRLDKLCGLPPI
jgi:hypothetical protein